MASLISVRDASNEFGLNEKTVRAYCQRGVRHKRHANGRIMIDAGSLLAFIQCRMLDRHAPLEVMYRAVAVADENGDALYQAWIDEVTVRGREAYGLDAEGLSDDPSALAGAIRLTASKSMITPTVKTTAVQP